MDKSKQTNMTSARLFVDNNKLAQTAVEFPKRLKACAKAILNIHNEC